MHWILPPYEWVLNNTNGTKHVDSSRASYRGVICDHLGVWCMGFAKFIGVFSIVEAMLWGVLWGLTLAWLLGFCQVIIEIDSEDALRLIRQSQDWSCYVSILDHIYILVNCDRLVKFRHIHQNGNKVADSLTKLVDWTHHSCSTFLSPPVEVEPLLHEDNDVLVTD
ncbi:hypothetical protein V6N13_074449 [Hibiscus sabdariffa]